MSASTAARESTPVSGSDVMAIDTAEYLCSWLEKALIMERAQIMQILHQRHTILLAEAQNQIAKWHTDYENGPQHACHQILKESTSLLSEADGVEAMYPDAKYTSTLPTQDAQLESSDSEANTKADSPEALLADTLEHEKRGGCDFMSFMHLAFVSSKAEFVFAMVILLNGVVACLQAQYLGFDNGYSIGYNHVSPAQDSWPGLASVFSVLEWVFGIIFTIELVGKLSVLRCQFPRSGWNWFDAFIVVMWAVDTFVDGEFNPTFLRMARFGRVLRLIRLIRWVSSCESLLFIVKAISGSFAILFWSLVIILLILSIMAVAMSNIVGPFIQDGSQDIDARTSIYKNWGSFTRALVTMFEATLANWGPICWNLSNYVSEWFGLFFILYKCIIGLAVVQVILSVFIQQTFKVAAQDEEIIIAQQKQKAAATLKQLTQLFDTIDTSGDGKISPSELTQVMANPLVKTWFSLLGVDTKEVTELFSLLDDGDGCLDSKEFIEGLQAIRGVGKKTDMLELKRQIQKFNSLMIEVHKCMVGTGRSTLTDNIPTNEFKLLAAQNL